MYACIYRFHVSSTPKFVPSLFQIQSGKLVSGSSLNSRLRVLYLLIINYIYY